MIYGTCMYPGVYITIRKPTDFVNSMLVVYNTRARVTIRKHATDFVNDTIGIIMF